jgi:hypothetical protein
MTETRSVSSTFSFWIAAFAISLSFWIVPASLAVDKNPDALVLFRQGGDPDYLPQVAAAAHLQMGEISVKEYAGTGVRTFPLVPIAIHALFFRVAGSIGFILADILLVLLYAWLLRQLLLLAHVAQATAELLALCVISGAAFWFRNKAGIFLRHPLPALFWEFRFPRPSVTQIIFLTCLILAALLFTRPQRPNWFFVALGLSFAATLQSDIYSAFDAAFVVGAGLIFMLAVRADRWAAMKQLGVTALSFAVASVPFIYQQLHTSFDVTRRWGVISMGRYGAMLPALPVMVSVLIVVLLAIFLAILYRRRNLQERIPALAVLATATGASIVTGPLSLAIFHRTIQIYHFFFHTALMIGYSLLLYAGWLLTDLRRVLPFRKFSIKGWLTPTAIARVVLIGFCIAVAYRSAFRHSVEGAPTAGAMRDLNLVHYRSDFGDLHRVLARPEFANAMVLGTFDRQLSNWWEYRRRFLLLVDLFNSTVGDSVAESRVFQFLRLLGANSQDFAHLLDDKYFLVQAIGLAKYQANSVFTPWPLADYSAAARRNIAATSWAFHLELPGSERSRLLREYEQSSQTPADAPDIVVLDNDALRGCLHPERAGRLSLAWSNSTFEVWAPKTSELPGR